MRVGSRRGFAVYPAAVTTRVRPGECFAPFHWNDLYGENLAINAATSEAVDGISLQPEFKFTAVTLTRMEMKARDDFSPRQKDCLRDLMSGMAHAFAARAPELPASAPFTAAQREYINSLLEKMNAET